MKKMVRLPQRLLRGGIFLSFLILLVGLISVEQSLAQASQADPVKGKDPGAQRDQAAELASSGSTDPVFQLTDPVNLVAEKISLADLLTALQGQTGYAFSYDKNRLSSIIINHIRWEKMPLGKALHELQVKGQLQYALLDKNIAITVKEIKPEPAKTTLQATSLKGRVVDFESSQPLPGATVVLRETGQSVLTDEKGYYQFRNIPDGSYELIVSYAGYQKNYLPGVILKDGKAQVVDIKMQAGSALGEVVVQAGARRLKSVTHSTEKDLTKEIRNSIGVVSGISNEMIARTGDRNAAEVVKHIAGVTVIDNRFIVVRGMNERYNLTYLNDNIAPSTELYNKAFAYDLLPSSIIDKILVYKSPRPDFSGEFAGAAVKIYTKNAMPVRHFDIGVQLAHRPGSTMTDINSYSGGKRDWLGLDDGTRKLPGFSPGYFESNKTTGNISQTDRVKGFSPVLMYDQAHSTPDMQFFLNYYDSYRLGRGVNLYDLTSVTFTKETTFYDVYRQSGNTNAYGAERLDIGGNNQIATNLQTTEIGKFNIMENLTLKLNPRNSIQFKNFFVNDGRKSTSINDMRANTILHYDQEQMKRKDIILSFQQRLLYSGNLGGTHHWGHLYPQDLEWNAGYTYDLQNVPDQRISHFGTYLSTVYGVYGSNNLPYTAIGSNDGSYDAGFKGMISRLFIKNKEIVYNGSVDYTFHLKPWFLLKTGVSQLFRTKDVGRRFFRVNRAGLAPGELNIPANQSLTDGWTVGYGVNNPRNLNFQLQDLATIWSPVNFPDNNTGLAIYDATSPVDAYSATEQNDAVYGMGEWKTKDGKLSLTGGLRVEYDRQKLGGAEDLFQDGSIFTIWVDHKKTNVLPSLNISYRPNSRYVIRAGYGRTVNRPEFRELTPYNDYDFINNQVMVGNPNTVSATIDNFDLRAELYPTGPAQDETVNIGIFYKTLQNPIERFRWDKSAYTDNSALPRITFGNSAEAKVYGLEAELKKNLGFIGGRFFQRLSILVNGTWNKSTTRTYAGALSAGFKLDTGQVYKGRPLQGQAPYVLNGGLFYEHPGWGTKIGLVYNVTGPTIYAKSLANPNDPGRTVDSNSYISTRPDLLQLPMHLLDFSLTQRIVRSLKLKFSIQNLLDQSYRIVEDQNYNQRYDPEHTVQNAAGETYGIGDNIYTRYKPGRYFILSFTYAF